MSVMRLVLEISSGRNQGRVIEVRPREKVRVGRTEKAEIALGDHFLSGVHFQLECDGKECRIKDLKSRNGTKVNGEPIQEAILNDGDQVFAGETTFVVKVGASADVAVTGGRLMEKSQSGSKRSKKSRKSRKSSDQEDPTYDVNQSSSDVTPTAKSLPTVVVSPEGASEVGASERPKSDLKQKESIAPGTSPTVNESATPEARLFQILSNQPQHVMALIDGVRDSSALDLLKLPGVQYESLYTNQANAKAAPYLINLPPGSELLKEVIHKSWGQEWGVYLTCSFSITELRDYFRGTLMITMPDGMELFSRFYDPRFFRDFLEGSDASEAGKFFGPVTSYFMEDARPEILLEFTNSSAGTQKKGHLLADLV